MTQETIKLLENAEYGTLALSDGNKPYAVALNFVYLDNAIYFHCSKPKRNKRCSLLLCKNYKAKVATKALIQ